MQFPNSARVALATLMVLSCTQLDTAPGDLFGQWGGDHAGLTVSLKGGDLEYDCAVGHIDPPVMVDQNGLIRASGIHIPGHGGPVRLGEKPDSLPAWYEGRIEGDTMTLTVTLTKSGDVVGTFILLRGRSPHVFKCV